jgi:glycine reductase
MVSGNYDIGATRNPTYMYQRCPIVHELLTRQTEGTLSFAGVVVSQCLIEGYNGKRRSAHLAAEAARLLGADGAVISIEECGHAYADLMLTCQACEDLGVKTVLLMAESSGADGHRAPALAFADAADAVVSVGNMDEIISLPAVETVLGGTWFRGRWLLHRTVNQSVETPLVNIFAATCQMGPNFLRTELY